MPKNRTQRLTQGAMMVALFTVLSAIVSYVPVLSVITIWFIPLPIAWYSAMYDRKASSLVAIVSIVLTILISGILALPLAVVFCLAGFIIGDAIRTKKSKVFLLMSTGVTVLISTAFMYVISVKFFKIDFLKELMTGVRKSYEKSNELAESITGKAPFTAEQLENMFNLMDMAMPTLITMSVFILTFLLITVNLPLLKRLGITVPKFASFRDLKLPRSVLWYYMLVLIVTLFIKPESGTFIYIAFLNISFILNMLLLLQGISFIQYYMHQQGWPKWTVVVGTILALPLQSFVTLLGIVDLGFNIRALVTGMPRK
ncbi:YybS family protein [Viridibacillus sp. YIM B01967]|uniref:YybS family protein n=1 Tax=Viridibacillus soli TaxID=2798301 RepID=A0ABS1HBL9_9BACL|nr:YybS family protein [Viridibacillus soli]MBK3496802.1 YybS family protein [Viridibacillus soli]